MFTLPHGEHAAWAHYRLSDAVGGYVAPPGSWWENHTKKNYLCEHWPSSLACRYRKMYGLNKHFNLTAMSELLPASSPDNVTVLHARLGDVARGVGCWEVPCTGTRGSKKKTARFYTHFRSYYKTIAETLPRQPILVVASPHHGSARDRADSLTHLKLIICFFRAKGFDVTYNGDSGTPDADFTRMATARWFVPGGGGYSQLAAGVVKKRGFNVY